MNELVPKNRQLILTGFDISPVGLVANKNLTREQWENAGHTLGHYDRRIMWCIGDWINAGEASGYVERGKHQKACEEFNIAYSTAANATTVCKALESSRRREHLSFGHHAEVANRNDADELLDWCEDNDASIKELRAEKHKRDKLAKDDIPLPPGKYSVLYADPPWDYNDKCDNGAVQAGGCEKHYPSMSIDELMDLEVSEVAADDSVLFLWVTSPLMPDAFDLAVAWGFAYKAQFVWDKVRHNMGHYNSVRHEVLLICTKGSCTPQVTKLFDSVQSIQRTKHSEKPEEFREIIETLYPKGKKLELFARKTTKGWKSWGNEV